MKVNIKTPEILKSAIGYYKYYPQTLKLEKKKKKKYNLAIKIIKSFCLTLLQIRLFGLYDCAFPMFL